MLRNKPKKYEGSTLCGNLVYDKDTISKMWCEDTDDVQGSKTILYDTVTADTCYYTFVKTHRMYSTKSEP